MLTCWQTRAGHEDDWSISGTLYQFEKAFTNITDVVGSLTSVRWFTPRSPPLEREGMGVLKIAGDRRPNQVFVTDHIAKQRIRETVLSPRAEQVRELARREHVYLQGVRHGDPSRLVQADSGSASALF